ncbi:hypothetical protein RDI58_028291 [Solanum bulbocastanum]|uniref:Uncharacterized protein n=1 Tax=Solanum bulbocastanum TaxID=147425 RepID=A0AAN8Y104_SOLBU
MIQSRIIQCASFNEDEINVSNILLNLKDQIEESERKIREKLMRNIEKLTRCRESLRRVSNDELRQELETNHMLQYPMGQLPQAQPMFSSTNELGFVSYIGPIIGMPNIAERKA